MSRPLPGSVPSPNIWHHTETYELENRSVDPEGRIEAAMRDVLGGGWSGRDVLDLGCGTGFHLPRWAAEAAARVRRRAAPRPRGVAARRTPRLGERHGAARHGAAGAAAAGVGRRRAGPLGVLLRARLRARAARARPGGAPRRYGLRGRQRHVAQHVRGVVPARLPERATPTRWSGSGRPTAGSAGRWTSSGGSRRGPTWSPSYASSSTADSAAEALAEHEGTEVDYAVNLWWRDY